MSISKAKSLEYCSVRADGTKNFKWGISRISNNLMVRVLLNVGRFLWMCGYFCVLGCVMNT